MGRHRAWIGGAALFASATGIRCASFDAGDDTPIPERDAGGVTDAAVPLTDATDATGADVTPECGRDCLGGACVDGACQPVIIASGEPEVSEIAFDASSVYWVTSVANGAVRSCPRAGCGSTPPSTLVGGQDRPRGVAVVGPQLFWTDRATSGVQRCTLAACGATKAVMALTLDGGDELASDGTSVFALQGQGGQNLARCVADTNQCNIGTNINGDPPNRITAYGGYAFYGSAGNGGIRKWQSGYGSATPLVSGGAPAGSNGVAVTPDGGLVVFAGRNGVVASVPNGFAQNDAATLVSTVSPQSVAVDEKRAYFTDFGNGGPGSVFTCELAACSSTLRVLASGPRPFAIAMDDVSVYYSLLGDAGDAGAVGAIMRVAKP